MLDTGVFCHCVETVKQATSATDTAKTVTSVLALPLALTTFLIGYWQRERERTRSYYHKVVVDVVLQRILDFFGEQVEAMTSAGRDALDGLASARKAIPRSCRVKLSEFATGLFELQDKITERTAIFDEKIKYCE